MTLSKFINLSLEKKGKANRKMWPPFTREKLVQREELSLWADTIRKSGRSIVTLNGSFDLLHSGHLHILYEASLQGDVLMVALNSDRSIQQYKNPSRPFIPLAERLKLISAISFVDFVTWFEETDPRAILEEIRPNVHANGADWGKDCIEKEVVERCGGRIHIVSLVEGLSTTRIVEKIHATSC
jgi:rfaE bifunctional protein nucleotidyltransferase chain/domain